MSNTMHALQLVKYGSPEEAFSYNEQAPKPAIKSKHQVLVRIKAAGVNPVEAKGSSGNMKLATFPMKLPAVIGADFSGIIEEVGTAVKDFQVGDEVFGSLQLPMFLEGTFAQYTVVDTTKASIAKKPANVSFEQAASAGIAAITAYHGIIHNGKTFKNPDLNRKILIVGASGGVGSYGVQFGKAINKENTVVGICSSPNAKYVQSLGADRVVDYKDKAAYDAFITEEKGTFDIVFDCVGGEEYYNQLDPLLKKGGVYSTAVGPMEHAGSDYVGISQIASIAAKLVYKKLFGRHAYYFIHILPHGEFRDKISKFFESGAVHGTIADDSNIVPLREGVRAFEQLHTHRTVGKIVLQMD
ncbi:Mitochondrial outer membrane protein iml2 [Mucor velutinosus]|uniref:Mitochondrial outer membrane protein iml2 n=1 Tax=Mucor velutinosus TaxID=708070 RepID=A0AAN7D7I0_9FUNG|nr:Mitochondrial outer membrane protein iml2 [Mucor velutinosus]